MRILLYNQNEPYPKQGGMERVTDKLAVMLRDSGHEVVLLCKYKNRIGEKYDPPVPLFFMPDTISHSSPRNKQFILKLIRSKQIECIIDQCEGEIIGRYGYFEKRDFEIPEKIKLIAVLHSSAKSFIDFNYIAGSNGSAINTAWWKYFFRCGIYYPLLKMRAIRVRKKLYSELSNNYDSIVMLSERFFEEFQFFAPKVNSNKLAAIPNPNTYEKLIIKTEKINELLFVGRLYNKAKGIDRLLKIWSSIYKNFPDWHLTIVGDGPDREMLINLSHELKLERVFFEGYQNPTEYYERAKIFCMTSSYEGFGMVLTEAMQHGMVPIAFNSYPSVADIIESEKNGYLISAFDENEYRDKLCELMQDCDLIIKLSKQAIESIKKFDPDNILRIWNKILISSI